MSRQQREKNADRQAWDAVFNPSSADDLERKISEAEDIAWRNRHRNKSTKS